MRTPEALPASPYHRAILSLLLTPGWVLTG